MTETKRMTLALPDDLYERLRTESYLSQRKMASIVREAVGQFLDAAEHGRQNRERDPAED